MTKRKSLNPAALAPRDAAALLSGAIGKPKSITTAMIRADIKSGAPTNSDGTMNLLHYTAWLAKNAS